MARIQILIYDDDDDDDDDNEDHDDDGDDDDDDIDNHDINDFYDDGDDVNVDNELMFMMMRTIAVGHKNGGWMDDYDDDDNDDDDDDDDDNDDGNDDNVDDDNVNGSKKVLILMTHVFYLPMEDDDGFIRMQRCVRIYKNQIP